MANLVQLNEDQFKATFVDPMHRLGEDEDYEAVSLKEYVTECIADLGLATTLDCLEIHHVYINGNKTSCHVMLYYGEPNRYLVIVTDYVNRTIRGHRVLDLNEKYGIPNTE